MGGGSLKCSQNPIDYVVPPHSRCSPVPIDPSPLQRRGVRIYVLPHEHLCVLIRHPKCLPKPFQPFIIILKTDIVILD